tara:strand:+ start:47 stop:601 length:555 start_codon:yes stop_codon:yes gene_type:complete
MRQQMKGNRMPKYKTKKGEIKTVKPISKAAQKLLGMKNVKKKAGGGKLNALQKRKIANEKALKSGFMNLTEEEYKKEKDRLARLPARKKKGGKVMKANMGKLLETVSPAYSIMKGKGPISDVLSKMGGMGLGGIAGMLAKNQKQKKNPMMADPMQQMQRMYGGGAMKKRRDGIASKGKTKGTIR